MLRKLGSASCDVAYESAGVRFVSGIVFCILRYVTRDIGYDLFWALGSASCHITHETGATIFYWHWVLRLLKSHTRLEVRFVTGVGSCIL